MEVTLTARQEEGRAALGKQSGQSAGSSVLEGEKVLSEDET